MGFRKLFFWALFSFLVLISMSMVSLADEYREVQASDILKQIENGEDVNLTDCRIIGELNLSEIELETVPNPIYSVLLSERNGKDFESYGITKELKIVESNIIIHNSIFENNFNFSNSKFNKSLSLENCFSEKADFTCTTFGHDTDLRRMTFGDNVGFEWATFGNNMNFSESTFGNNTNFLGATFGDYANFEEAIWQCTESSVKYD